MSSWRLFLLCVGLILSSYLLLHANSQDPQETTTQKRAPSATLTLGPPSTVITTGDNGKEFTLPKGGVLIVRLPGNPSTGYSWVLNSDPTPLALTTTDYERPKQTPPIAGAPRTQQLRFTAEASGTVTIQLAYRRPWEKDVAPLKTFSVTVNVE